MVAKITFPELTEKQKLQTADLLQKLEAIEGALAILNDERVATSAVYNKKQFVLEEERKVIKQQLRGLRTAILAE